MSLLGTTHVYICDGCNRVRCVHTDYKDAGHAAEQAFQQAWFVAAVSDYHYCHECRFKLEHQAMILADEAAVEQLTAEFRDELDRFAGNADTASVGTQATSLHPEFGSLSKAA